jgi:hypothetical protein
MGVSGYVTCLASLCPLTAVHIYWSSETSLLQGSEFYVINNRSYSWQIQCYPAVVSKKFRDLLWAPDNANVAVVLSLQVLAEICSWNGTAGHPGRRSRMRISSLSDVATSSWRMFISHTKENLDDAVDRANRWDADRYTRKLSSQEFLEPEVYPNHGFVRDQDFM